MNHVLPEQYPQRPHIKDSLWTAISSVARVKIGRGLTGKIHGLHIVAIIALIIMVIVGTFFFHWLPLLGIAVLLYFVHSCCKRMDEATTKYPMEALEGYERVQFELGQLAFKHGSVPDNMTLVTSPSQLLASPKAEDLPDKQHIVLIEQKEIGQDEPEKEPGNDDTGSETTP